MRILLRNNNSWKTKQEIQFRLDIKFDVRMTIQEIEEQLQIMIMQGTVET